MGACGLKNRKWFATMISPKALDVIHLYFSYNAKKHIGLHWVGNIFFIMRKIYTCTTSDGCSLHRANLQDDMFVKNDQQVTWTIQLNICVMMDMWTSEGESETTQKLHVESKQFLVCIKRI